MRVAVVGHMEWAEFARVERVPAPGEIVQAAEGWEEPAGGGAVAAVQLARLAGECLFLTALGDDDLGHRAERELQALGVRVEAAWRSEPQRRAFVHLDAEGERTITVIGERAGPHADDPLPWSELEDADAVYFTAGDPAAVRAARAARQLVSTVRALDSLAKAGVEIDMLVSSAEDEGERYSPGDIEPPPRFVARTAGAAGGALETVDGASSSMGRPSAARPRGRRVRCRGLVRSGRDLWVGARPVGRGGGGAWRALWRGGRHRPRTVRGAPPRGADLMSDREERPEDELTAAEFRQLFKAVSTWGRWGAEDERGALNYLTPARVLQATRLVRSGETVTLSLPLNTRLGIDNPAPADHHMTMMGDEDIGSGTLRFAKDYVGADYHNPSHTHIDALCHVAFDGTLYNGRPSASLTHEGATADDIGALKHGLVGRGVLLDVPALRGVRWLEPGEHVFPDELEGCERKQGVTVREGDILLVRTGHAQRHADLGPWDSDAAKAGLHPTCATFLAERRIAALGSDGNSDTTPSTTEGIDFPIHALMLNAMGVHLLDYLQFEDLVPACEREGRWEFLFLAAPLRVIGGTGSPLNPVAVL